MWDQIQNVFFTQVLNAWIRAIVTSKTGGPGVSMNQMIWKFPLLGSLFLLRRFEQRCGGQYPESLAFRYSEELSFSVIDAN